MKHSRLTNSITDNANAYALGLLNERQSRIFDQHVKDGCALCEAEVRAAQEAASLLAASLPGATPPNSVRERLLAQLELPSADRHARYVVRGEDDAWRPAGVSGVMVKTLFVDMARERVTTLVRMEAGATYPAHRHGGPEQCYVLEGDLTNDVALQTGDFALSPADSTHPVSRTRHGCLLLIISSTHDELIT